MTAVAVLVLPPGARAPVAAAGARCAVHDGGRVGEAVVLEIVQDLQENK